LRLLWLSLPTPSHTCDSRHTALHHPGTCVHTPAIQQVTSVVLDGAGALGYLPALADACPDTWGPSSRWRRRQSAAARWPTNVAVLAVLRVHACSPASCSTTCHGVQWAPGQSGGRGLLGGQLNRGKNWMALCPSAPPIQFGHARRLACHCASWPASLRRLRVRRCHCLAGRRMAGRAMRSCGVLEGINEERRWERSAAWASNIAAGQAALVPMVAGCV
jgi:hypothetical protein